MLKNIHEHSNTRTPEQLPFLPFAEKLADTRDGGSDDMAINMTKAKQWYMKSRDYMGKGHTLVVDTVYVKFRVLDSLLLGIGWLDLCIGWIASH